MRNSECGIGVIRSVLNNHSALRLPNSATDFIYGRRPVFEAFEAGKRAIHKLWVVQGTGGGVVEQILKKARERGIPIEWTRFEWLDQKIGAHRQGIAAQVSAAEFLELEDFLATLGPTADCLLLGLDEIQDPQNLGAILRSAAFFGVQAAIVPRWRSAPVSESAVRASSGGVEHLALIRVRNLADAMLQLKEAGFQLVGADAAGTPLQTHTPASRTVLILGNEGYGMRRLVKERCDKLLSIPVQSSVGSLNVSPAAAIFLYEFFRRRF